MSPLAKETPVSLQGEAGWWGAASSMAQQLWAVCTASFTPLREIQAQGEAEWGWVCVDRGWRNKCLWVWVFLFLSFIEV